MSESSIVKGSPSITESLLKDPEYIKAYIEQCNESLAEVLGDYLILKEQSQKDRKLLEEMAKIWNSEEIEYSHGASGVAHWEVSQVLLHNISDKIFEINQHLGAKR